uniref:Uncharacterized protein n=1 Tax=Fagus sylvatica TaxID=28930 RepID=A0A2N9FUM5_FAGSY
MEFFCWFLFPAAAVQEERKNTLNLGLKKGAWIQCIAGRKGLAGARWVAGCAGWALLAGLAGWACWLCWLLGLLALLAGLLLPCSFQQPVCCYCFIFLFLLLFHGKLLGALCPLYSRLACELIKALLEPQFV